MEKIKFNFQNVIILVTALLCFSSIGCHQYNFLAETNKNIDTSPPKLLSIAISQKTLDLTQTSELTVKIIAIDEGSGIMERGGKSFSLKGVPGQSFLLSKTIEPDIYIGTAIIPTCHRDGNDEIDRIWITDQAGNFSCYKHDMPFPGNNSPQYYTWEKWVFNKSTYESIYIEPVSTDIPVVTFEVKNPNPDITPPVLESLSVSDMNYNTGDLTLTYTISDFGSEPVNIVFFVSFDKKENPFDDFGDYGFGYMDNYFGLNPFTANGSINVSHANKWVIDRIIVQDLAANETYYSYVPSLSEDYYIVNYVFFNDNNLISNISVIRSKIAN